MPYQVLIRQWLIALPRARQEFTCWNIHFPPYCVMAWSVKFHPDFAHEADAYPEGARVELIAGIRLLEHFGGSGDSALNSQFSAAHRNPNTWKH